MINIVHSMRNTVLLVKMGMGRKIGKGEILEILKDLFFLFMIFNLKKIQQ